MTCPSIFLRSKNFIDIIFTEVVVPVMFDFPAYILYHTLNFHVFVDSYRTFVAPDLLVYVNTSEHDTTK